MLEMLHTVLKTQHLRTLCQNPYQENNGSVEQENQLHWQSSHIKLVVLLTISVFLRFFPSYIYDWATDVLVINENRLLSEQVRGNITFADNLPVSRTSFLNSIPWDIAAVLLGVSTLLTLPKLGRLRDLINVQCVMKDPQTETADLQIVIKTVVKRHDTSLIETATESSAQVVFQWGSYMGLIYLVDKVKNQDENLSCSDEQNVSKATLCILDDTIAFRRNGLLWVSGLASLLSLTLAQRKAHNVQHEFCTSWQMKSVYVFAALMNTISYLFLLVSCFTSTNDFINLITDELDARGHSQLLELNRVSISIICLLVIGCISLLARFLIFKNKPSSENSLSLTKKHSCPCKIGRLTNLKNFARNLLKFFSLPTSQFSYKDEYFCYQSKNSVDYIKFFMVQCLLNILFMV
eukprot:GFUD01015555.1.p1 GENE.GFUD01015555.1~~GFUD01015555.1.p1  ORF type:complete len:407 (-),score=53.63 GFUD01015555.1:291-1511(-)